MYDEEQESEYMTILEMLQEMPLGKAIMAILGFYIVIGSVTMSVLYFLLKR
jgi:hypothetical protein